MQPIAHLMTGSFLENNCVYSFIFEYQNTVVIVIKLAIGDSQDARKIRA